MSGQTTKEKKVVIVALPLCQEIVYIPEHAREHTHTHSSRWILYLNMKHKTQIDSSKKQENIFMTFDGDFLYILPKALRK